VYLEYLPSWEKADPLGVRCYNLCGKTAYPSLSPLNEKNPYKSIKVKHPGFYYKTDPRAFANIQSQRIFYLWARKIIKIGS